MQLLVVALNRYPGAQAHRVLLYKIELAGHGAWGPDMSAQTKKKNKGKLGFWVLWDRSQNPKFSAWNRLRVMRVYLGSHEF